MHTPLPARRPAAFAIAALCAASVVAPAAAQGFIVPGEETLTLSIGGIVNRFDSDLRLDGTTIKGTPINLENNGLDQNLSTLEAALTWRFAPRHRLDVTYFGGDRDGSRRYDSSITIGDSTFPVGATVSVKAKSTLTSLDYRYSIVKDPGFELGLLLGFHAGKFTYDVDAVGNAGAATGTYHKSVSTDVPLPLLGATFDWYLDRQLKLNVTLAGIKASIGDVDGHAYIASAAAEWMFTRHLGLGAKYQFFDVGADVGKNDFRGELGVKTNSVSLYGKFLF
jgi:hypothetical protein